MRERNKNREMTATVILIVAALIVCIPLASWLSKPGTYKSTFASLDDKMENVLSLTTACTVTSSALTAIPDDFATPIATQLAEYTDYLLLIFSILLTEKYLLSFIGMLTFRIVIPIAFIAEIPVFRWKLSGIRRITRKMAAFFLAVYLVIPASMLISDMISDTYDISFDKTISAAQEFSVEAETSESTSFWSKMTDTISNVTSAVTNLPQKVSEMMNQFVQSIAVMIVTSCFIPLLVLLFFLWVVKLLTGRPISMHHHGEHGRRGHRIENTIEEKELVEV